ncbi:MAG: hemerythrin family protein [Elusimicrobia bacterium]|nr:hemerythrin family protein [Elusimicrobiota bacterium]
MALMLWSDQYRTGLPGIDREHQELFQCVNAFDEALRQGLNREQVAETIEFLIHYTANHFSKEEILLARTAYPGLRAHKARHAELMEHVTAMAQTYQLTQSVLTVEVSQFLADWLSQHVLKDDLAYASWVKSTSPPPLTQSPS